MEDKLKVKYLIRKRQIGDVLWIEPVIRQLSVKHATLYVHTKYNQLFENYPLANVVFKDKLTVFEKIFARLESIFNTSFLFINLDMAYERRPQMHFLNAYQKQAHLPLTHEYPQIYLSQDEWATKIINADKYVILHLDSESDKNYRKIYGIDWKVVSNYLIEKGYQLVKIGKTSIQIGEGQAINTTIRQLINVIKNASFFIGIDSGPSHIAASLQIPALIFFGSVNPAFRHFKDLFKGFFLQQPCEFAGCYHLSINQGDRKCRLVGDEGIPKCSVHTTEYLIKKIDLLTEKYSNDS